VKFNENQAKSQDQKRDFELFIENIGEVQ